MDESVRLRPGTAADFEAVRRLKDLCFHHETGEAARKAQRIVAEPQRSVLAEDDGLLVGHATAYTRELTVPGAVVPAAHVTGVVVAPTHRRRGILSAMMHQQLAGIPEPLAVLWASETAIYPRFGYGPSASRLRLNVATKEVRLTSAAPRKRLRLIDPAMDVDLLGKIHERVRPAHVGWSSRDANWWQVLTTEFADENSGKVLRGAVCEDGTGYALWSITSGWNEYGPDSRVEVHEVVAEGVEAYTSIWGFLFGIDLTRSVTYSFGALDEPLQYLVDEPRRLGRRVGDGLWIRLTDLPRALTARRYAAPLDVVIDVTDPLLPANAGRWRLTGDRCERTDAAPDFSCTITELGAAYLGATSLGALAAAGRITRHTGNLPSAAFGWHRLPDPIEVF